MREPTIDTQSFGELLKSFRSRTGMSQESLAEEACLSVETMSSLERGARRSPYRDTIRLLATVLALSPGDRGLLESAAARSSALRRPVAVRASLQSVRGAAGNLPLQLTSFVGRETELGNILALLAANRLVTLKPAPAA